MESGNENPDMNAHNGKSPEKAPGPEPAAPDEFLAASAARRVELIRARLEEALAPVVSVDVRDDSAQHAGHAGHAGRAMPPAPTDATPGAAADGHYHVTVIARAFRGQSRVARHRLVYDALAAAMRRGIHALAITALAPEEAAQNGRAPPAV